MALVGEFDVAFLELERIQWGAKAKADGTQREPGAMWLLRVLASEGLGDEFNVADDQVPALTGLNRGDRVRLRIRFEKGRAPRVLGVQAAAAAK